LIFVPLSPTRSHPPLRDQNPAQYSLHVAHPGLNPHDFIKTFVSASTQKLATSSFCVVLQGAHPARVQPLCSVPFTDQPFQSVYGQLIARLFHVRGGKVSGRRDFRVFGVRYDAAKLSCVSSLAIAAPRPHIVEAQGHAGDMRSTTRNSVRLGCSLSARPLGVARGASVRARSMNTKRKIPKAKSCKPTKRLSAGPHECIPEGHV
jgi:hypothetical protein